MKELYVILEALIDLNIFNRTVTIVAPNNRVEHIKDRLAKTAKMLGLKIDGIRVVGTESKLKGDQPEWHPSQMHE